MDQSGVIERLSIRRGSGEEAAEYRFSFKGGEEFALNSQIGKGLKIEFTGHIVCRYCDKAGVRSFAGGYCYECFTTLARCDLCVVSPDRCHYDKGTCREEEWGESFCMQPHLVYLANSSGIKVGITRRGMEVGRWLDQGAIQGRVILEVPTRKSAGLAEVAIAGLVPDRTDPRKMLRPDVPEQNLEAALDSIQSANLKLPPEARWTAGDGVQRLHYPLDTVPPRLETLKLAEADVEGNLIGMKGQYLLLSSGALNVRQHAGYQVRCRLYDEPLDLNDQTGTQLGLF